MKIREYRFSNKEGSWKPTRFTQNEMMLLVNIRKVMNVHADDEGKFDMRLIRGKTGRGLGNYFLEREDKHKFTLQADLKLIKIAYSTFVDHYDEDPSFNRINRESIFQGYSNLAHSQRSNSRQSSVYPFPNNFNSRGFSERHRIRQNTIKR